MCVCVQAHLTEKSSDYVVFSLVLNLFYSFTEGVQLFILTHTIIFQGSRGGPTFSRGKGVQLFPGKVQMLIPIETNRICVNFQVGGGS